MPSGGGGGMIIIDVDDHGTAARLLELSAIELQRAVAGGVKDTARVARNALKAEVRSKTARRSGKLRSAASYSKATAKRTATGAVAKIQFTGPGWYGRPLSTGTGERQRRNGGSTGSLAPLGMLDAADQVAAGAADALMEARIEKAIAKKGLA